MKKSSRRRSVLFVLNGPNLNLLGKRQPEIYGSTTLAQIYKDLDALAKRRQFQLVKRQSNTEGDLVDWIQEADDRAMGILLNPGAYTHTSIAIRDALASVAVPCIEVHLSNIFARESFRRKSLISPVARAVVSGLGPASYRYGLLALMDLLEEGTRK